MYILRDFGSTVMRDVGREKFLTIYGAGAVGGSVGSLLYELLSASIRRFAFAQ